MVPVQERAAAADKREALRIVGCLAQSFAGRAGVEALLEEAGLAVGKWLVPAAVGRALDRVPVCFAPRLAGCRRADLAYTHSSAGALDLEPVAGQGWKMFGASGQDVDLLLTKAATSPEASATVLFEIAASARCASAETVQARLASRVGHAGSQDGFAWPSWDALAQVFPSDRPPPLRLLHLPHHYLIHPCPQSRPVLCVRARRHTRPRQYTFSPSIHCMPSPTY